MNIENKEQLRQAIEHLGRLYEALADLKNEIWGINPKNFLLFAEGPLREIHQVREEIMTYAGESIADEAEVDIRIKIIGPTVKWRETRIGIITAFLNSLRKGVQQLAVFNESLKSSPWTTKMMKIACDLQLVDLAPGSLDIGLNIPFVVSAEQTDLFKAIENTPARPAMDDFLQIAKWASSSLPPNELDKIFSDQRKRRVALKAIKPFIPRKLGDVDSVQIYGPIWKERDPISLNKLANDRIASAFAETLLEREVRHEGHVREINLDSRTFILKTMPEAFAVHCSFSSELERTAIGALNRRVIIIGITEADISGEAVGRLKVSELIPVEDN